MGVTEIAACKSSQSHSVGILYSKLVLTQRYIDRSDRYVYGSPDQV